MPGLTTYPYSSKEESNQLKAVIINKYETISKKAVRTI